MTTGNTRRTGAAPGRTARQRTGGEQNGKGKKRQQKKKGFSLITVREGQMDYLFLLLVIVILAVGLVSLFSASHAHGYYNYKGSSFEFISKQLIYAGAGVALMFLFSGINYKIFTSFKGGMAWLIMAVTVVLLIVVFQFPALNNAHRWIIIGDMTIQPSEVAKFSIVVLFAHLSVKNADQMNNPVKGLLPFVAVLGIVAFLIFREPHLSGTVLILLLGVSMMWLGGVKWYWFPALAIAGVVMVLILLAADKIPAYVLQRIEIWENPWSDPRDMGYQNIQSLYAIGSGGFLGVGIGNSTQKVTYLPEPQNDFIFAIVCEEIGLVGAVMIILLFAMLVWRGFVIGLRCRDRFGSLLAMGLTAQIAFQTIWNIAVVTNAVPNTGISLPFFSAGGTSLVMLLVQMGIVLSVSRHSGLPAEETEIELRPTDSGE